MSWQIVYHPEAKADLKRLDGSQRIQVLKAIRKVAVNPLPKSEGGYGKPLGNRNGNDLTGYLKIKLLASGIRVVYQLIRTEKQMLIVVIGMRTDEDVYEIAQKRK